MNDDQERSGGECGSPVLTARQGDTSYDSNDSGAVRDRGLTLLENYHFLDKTPRLDRERIPERVVHARNAGAHGYFEAYGAVGGEPVSKYTRAMLFQERAKRTPLFIRFSTVIHGGHSPETLRDPRGFAIKFYSDDGLWDLVGNNLPVSFVRDEMQFPKVVHAFKPDPVTNRQDPRRIFDFVSDTPSAMHMITWLFSPWGIPANYREMRGSGARAQKWVNDDGQAVLVKYHFLPKGGERNLTQEQANRIQATNFNHATQDLYDAIERGDFPEWEMAVQIMEDGEHPELDFDPLDPTKIWPPEQYPLLPVGRVVLDRNPQNYFAEVEQIAFGTGVLVDGMDLCDDPPLCGRTLPYAGTQHYGVGSSDLQLPVNRPSTHVAAEACESPMSDHVGGVNADEDPHGNYESSPRDGLKLAQMPGEPHAAFAHGSVVHPLLSRENNYAQAGERYRTFQDWERDELIRNLVGALSECEREIQRRMVEHFRQCDADYGRRVAEGLGLAY
ncbi:catalase [Lysobacter korlensis]|uniref:Catalase n=1 Tax=Lysobacter korlensis TaxID=553636 RepID=A0ABV6RLG5_9GAMM